MHRIAGEIGGFTVEDLQDHMSGAEMVRWAAFFEMRQEAEDRAVADAKRKGGGDGPGGAKMMGTKQRK